MTRSPDPVAEGAAYRALLIGLCGDDDPAEVQSQTPDVVRGLVLESESHLRARPEQGEWSVLELVGHLTDCELVMAGRYRWVLAHEEPELPGYDQDRWAERLRHNEADPDRLIRFFEALRAANLALWLRTPAEERSRAAIHQERGRETYGEMFRLIAGHDRFHLDQAAQTLESLRARA